MLSSRINNVYIQSAICLNNCSEQFCIHLEANHAMKHIENTDQNPNVVTITDSTCSHNN